MAAKKSPKKKKPAKKPAKKKTAKKKAAAAPKKKKKKAAAAPKKKKPAVSYEASYAEGAPTPKQLKARPSRSDFGYVEGDIGEVASGAPVDGADGGVEGVAGGDDDGSDDDEHRSGSKKTAPRAKPAAHDDPAVDLAQGIAALALEKKAEDVVILKVTDLTSYADCFILASAPSERQVQAIARHVDDEMRRAGKAPVGTEGLEQGHWVLVDLGAAVLHVFLSSARQYYDLEGFWAEAPRVDVDEALGKEVVASMIEARAAAKAAGDVA